MKRITWLILILVIVSVMLIVVNTGITTSYFTDDEPSTDDALGIKWGLITLDDGFEGTPWDDNWDENDATTWTQDSANPHSGTYNAYCDKNNPGYLTTDEIDASASTTIAVSFWFKAKGLDAGDYLVQIYNGTSYNTWYDLSAYSTYVDGTWCQFSELITDPQYFIPGFRLRLDTSLISGAEDANIDDVMIITDSTPPVAPANLAATAGEEEVSLDWDDNSEPDVASYNIYRSLISLGPYTYIDNSTDSEFLDTGLTNDVTYYYVVTAVDTGTNESGNSDEVFATPTDMAPAAPEILSAIAGDRLVDLNWNDNDEPDLAGYNIYRSESATPPYDYIDSSTLSEYVDEELSGGTTYYYVVTAFDGNPYESDPSNEASATPSDLPPAAPTNLSALAGDRQVSLDWDDNGETDLAGYKVYRSLISLGPYDYIDSSTLSEYVDEELSGGTTYYYVVTAVDTNTNESGYSNQNSAMPTDTTPPAAPTNLVATPGDEKVTLGWDDNLEPDLAGYNVHRSVSDGGPYTQINGALVETSAYTDNTVTNYVTYYYVVTAVDTHSNESGYSNQDSAMPTDTTPPAAPTSLVATPGDTQVTLEWDDNLEPDLDGYNVHRSVSDGGPYTQINGALVDTSGYTDDTVTNGITYYYVVTAVDTNTNESGYSNQDDATPVDSPPAAPTTLVATPGDTQVTLEWDDNLELDLAGYNVHRSVSDGGPYTQINGALVETSAYTDDTATNYVTYYYVVTAVDTNTNESGYSNQDDAMPTDTTPPAAPTTLVATPGDEEVTLEWDDNLEPDLAGYNVHRSVSDGGPYTQINGALVETSAYTDNTVTNYVTYYYVVTAIDTNTNESGYSNQDSAMPTDTTPPAAPTTLVATPGDAQVTLEWDDNLEPDLAGYNVHRSESDGGPYTQINGALVETSGYTDNTVTNGVTYYYVVTAVDTNTNESGYSNQNDATPVDLPPVAPTSLVATPGGKLVTLEWDDNLDPDLAGYNVHRSVSDGGPYTQINGALVETSDYLDTGLTAGTIYYYVVTAVDTNTNESGYSNQDDATPTPVILINDGFEGTPWDANWDGNGTTDWTQNSSTIHGDLYSAGHASGNTYLTSDNLDASDATSITVSFWFNMKLLNKGPLNVQIYNGTAYNTWYNLAAYPGVVKNTWIQFSQTITDSQYFISGFRIRFDGSTLTTDAFIDDVLIQKN